MNASPARRHGSDAGIVVPMTVIIMALITALTVAVLAFTSTEPFIASNQMANDQARATEESGLERALWALTKGEANPAATGALADPLPNPVPVPYDGSQYVAAGVGGFIVTVTNGGAANERNITAVGYVPNNVNPIAIKKIQTTVTKVKFLDPPCAVCAGGEQPPGTSTQIQVGGSASITASTAQGAQYCAGVTPTAAAYAQGPINTNGWLVVAGTIDISGNITMNGLIYAQNDVSLRGAGAGSITGAVISTNRVDAASTNVDTDDIGNAPITYNCPSVRSGGGTIPQNWFVKPGTYKEVSGT